MRHKLFELLGQRLRFSATVERFGGRRSYKRRDEFDPTILLSDLRLAETGELLADHLWFRCGRWSAGLQVGDRFEFEARIDTYSKGYERDQIDCHLERPTKLKILHRREPAEHVPTTYQESFFSEGDLVQVAPSIERHTHKDQVGRVEKVLHCCWVEVVFPDGYRWTSSDSRLVKLSEQVAGR